MRLPVRAITGHLLWGRDGDVWAAYRVSGGAFRHVPAREKLRWHARVQAAMSMLTGESLLLGVARLVHPAEIAGAMTCGIDLDACPGWRAEVAEAQVRLASAEIRERRHYVVTRLPRRRVARSAMGAATSAVAEHFGVSPAPIRARDVAARLRDAAVVEARLGALLALEPVSAGELRWLYARATRRGAGEPPLDRAWAATERHVGTGGAARLARPSLQPLAEGVFHEGGSNADAERPAHRRYLRVDTAHGTGYQAFLTIADMPREFFFPGGEGERFHHLDEVGFGVDWCARVASVPNEEARVRARRQARQLASQFDEHDGDTAGLPHDLVDAVAGVDEERAELASNKGEPELQATIVLATWSSDLTDLESRCQRLQSHFAAAEYGLARPTGGQLALFTAMLPGSPAPRVARDYTQFLLPRDVAAGAPFTGDRLGDPQGMVLAESLDAAGTPPVLLDPARGPRESRSGSVGVAGNLGSGKS